MSRYDSIEASFQTALGFSLAASTAKRIVDPGDGKAIYIVGILPLLYITTQIPGVISKWANGLQDSIWEPSAKSVVYVGTTAATVASMTASTMIGELVVDFGKDEPGWWVLIITGLFLAVLHLGKSALLPPPQVNQDAALEKRKELVWAISQIEDERTKRALELALGV